MMRLLIVELLVLASLSACGDREGQSASDPPSGGDGAAGSEDHVETAIPVRAAPVVREDLFTFMETYARLEPKRQVTVYARRDGLVERLLLEEGDSVRSGQALVELEREEASLLLQEARAEHAEARASFERSQQLHQKNMLSQEELEASRLRHESARVGLERAEIRLSHTTIRAPLEGVITRRLVSQGDLVNERQAICVIADLDLLLTRVFVPEGQIHRIRPEQTAEIDVEALPGRTFVGRIQMVSPEVVESGTVKVTLKVVGGEHLKPGMFATVRLVTGHRPQTLVMPKSALVRETEEEDVIAIVDSRAKRLPVELGLIEGDRVEVLAGVSEGDTLVTVGQNGLREGTLLRVVGPAVNGVAEETP